MRIQSSCVNNVWVQVFEKLSLIAALAMLPVEQQFVCPHPSCSELSMLDPSQNYRSLRQMCPHCQQPVCAHCKCIWHDGVTCDNYEGTPGDLAVLQLARHEGLARCPGCRIVIQRTVVSVLEHFRNAFLLFIHCWSQSI